MHSTASVIIFKYILDLTAITQKPPDIPFSFWDIQRVLWFFDEEVKTMFTSFVRHVR